MPVAKPVASDGRVIAHVDMDCFYVQVEQRKKPELRGLPTAVVQYNSWKGGGLIAVSYEARKYGVNRFMRGHDAKAICPNIQLVQVPVARGKADLGVYRNAGSEVVSILARKGRCERASIDEVYLDLTDAAETMLAENPPESLDDMDEEVFKSHILGLDDAGSDTKDRVKNWLCRNDADRHDKLLACGVLIVAELRAQVLKETEFTCSAGIAHNKMLAKLASGMNKPAQQTIVLAASVKELLGPLPIKKMKQLGGKLGDSLQKDLGVQTVGDLLQFSEEKLQEHYGTNTGTWLWNIARGISGEEVEGRLLPKSHGSGKTFPGPRALKTVDSVGHWLKELCEELYERLLADLDQNRRMARTLTLHARAFKLNGTDSKKFPSKSCLLRYGAAKIQGDALNLFNAGLREFMSSYVRAGKDQNNGWGVSALSVSASKIVEIPLGTSTIMKFFPSQDHVGAASSQHNINQSVVETVQPSAEGDDSYLGLKEAADVQQIMSKDGVSEADQLGQERKSQENLGTVSVMEVLCHQPIDCSALGKGANEGRIDLSTHGKAYREGVKQDEAATKIHGEEPWLSVKQREHTRKESKATSSILRFLKSSNHSCTSSKHEQIDSVQEAYAFASSDSRCADPGCTQDLTATSNHQGDNDMGRDHERQEEAESSSKRWSYNPDEIDPIVINELPPDIQEELRGWLRPLKRPPTASKGSSNITHYFLPTKGKK